MRGAWLALLTLLPVAAHASERVPLAPESRFRLFAATQVYFFTNRVALPVIGRGSFEDGAGDTYPQGGTSWPRSTRNQYSFGAGFQFAGIIRGSKPQNPWGGDTAGAMFWEATGARKHGANLTPVYLGTEPTDVASWPDLSRVPSGDASELLYDPTLRGRTNASEGDAHFIAWDGDPNFISGRAHPLGLVVEHRLLGWNYPSGNEDIVYMVVTYYNVTSLQASDYAQHRPAMRAFLAQKARDFHTLNNAKFGITLPANGYTIDELYTGFASDPDVGTIGQNVASVNLPFATGFAYQANFIRPDLWRFDPDIFSTPFFPGPGFIGITYLKTPVGPPAIHLYSNYCGSSSCPTDPNSSQRLWRTLAGRFDAFQGDGLCGNPGIPFQTHLCTIHQTARDVRHFQSTAPHSLAPGQSASVVIAMVLAAPVAIPGFSPSTTNLIAPGQASWLSSVDSMAKYGGVNKIDSITGYLGFTDNGDGIPQADEFRVVPRSLLGKARLAQQIFDVRFLLPAAPEPPDFFLIPGDKQVTVLWKPSVTETTGDPYFTVAGSATRTSPSGVAANMLYDPNFRRFDVEGYRLYRGRTSDPNSLQLISQWDHIGTTMLDYGGLVLQGGWVAPRRGCAPELGLTGTTNCPANFTPITPGVTSTVSFAYDLFGPLVQINYGGRDVLANGAVLLVPGQVDSALTRDGFPALADTDVPFVYVDHDVRNDLRYFYSVTTFDVNSLRSGPSSLESAKAVKSVTVMAPPSNVTSSGNVVIAGPFGRGAAALTDAVAPTLDSTTGRFSKRPLPSNGLAITLAGFAAQVLTTGEVAVRLDSITIADFVTGASVPATSWYSIGSGPGTTRVSVPFTVGSSFPSTPALSITTDLIFPAVVVDATLASGYGGGSGYRIPGRLHQTLLISYHLALKSRGCVNGNTANGFGPGRECSYNGPRFFVGDNESIDNPNSANPANFNTGNTNPTSYNNVGGLPTGVAGLHRPISYEYTSSSYRDIEVALSPFVSESDTRIYWGAAGRIDSVVDLSHNTVVPFSTSIGATWGVLNNSAVPATTAYDQRAVLTFTDISCVAPFTQIAAVQSVLPCTGGTAALSQTAIPGPMAYKFTSNTLTTARVAPVAANAGFLLYLRGNSYMVEMMGGAVPAAGSQWTVRDYVGAIRGGNGAAGQFGAYHFTPRTRPFTAIGASMKYLVTASNSIDPVTDNILARVHPVPDPYYVVAGTVTTNASAEIQFVNVPTGARIRIYSMTARLVRVLDADASGANGTMKWDVKGRDGRLVSSGVYFYHVEAGGRTRVGRMTIAHFGSDR